jgi:hypothetical protein
VTTPGRAQHAGRICGWTEPPGRGPASLLADRAWQAAGPRTVDAGQFRPDTVRQILIHFQLFKFQKLFQTSKIRRKLYECLKIVK